MRNLKRIYTVFAIGHALAALLWFTALFELGVAAEVVCVAFGVWQAWESWTAIRRVRSLVRGGDG